MLEKNLKIMNLNIINYKYKLYIWEIQELDLWKDYNWDNNRFKGLDLVDRVPEELWTEVCNVVQEAVTKITIKKKKYKKAKWSSEKP